MNSKEQESVQDVATERKPFAYGCTKHSSDRIKVSTTTWHFHRLCEASV